MAQRSSHDMERSSLAVEIELIERLKPDPENARVHSRAQLKQIARSIEAFRFNVPVLVDRDLKVLSGHGRLEALKLLGHTEVPIIRLEHLSAAQARAFAIAENRLVENSSWDERLLGLHFKALADVDLDFSLEATGFSIAEIDLKIEGLEVVEDQAAETEEELQRLGPAVSRLGDVWRLGEHTIICASSTEKQTYEHLLGAERVSAVFADPPYGDSIASYFGTKKRSGKREFVQGSGEMSEPERTAFLTKACQLAAEATVDGGIGFWCIDWRNLFSLLAAGRSSYDDLLNICVWTKNAPGMGSLYRSQHELVAVFKHGHGRHQNNVQLGRFGRSRSNVWQYPGANTFMRGAEDADLLKAHATPKPVGLVADALLDVTARRDLVLDPFLGTGATVIAAERTGRRCRGVDLDPLYVDLTIRRWQRFTGEHAIRAADGRRFSDLENEADSK